MPDAPIEVTGKVYVFQAPPGTPKMDDYMITDKDDKQVGIVTDFDPATGRVTSLIFDPETIEKIDGREKEISVGEGVTP